MALIEYTLSDIKDHGVDSSFVSLSLLTFIRRTLQPSKHSPVSSSSSSSTALEMKYTLVLVRHGESVWNDENRFTGWYDSQLSDKGISEAYAGGKLLADAGFDFDIAYTSTLKRAIKTLWIILEEMDLMHLPIVSVELCLASFGEARFEQSE